MTRRRSADQLHAILLAAGTSSRFGTPKQLAEVAGRPMLTRTLQTAIDSVGRAAVTVVLGAHAERLEPLIRGASVAVVVNPDYEQGMASSIRTGLNGVPADANAVLILLADQVAVTADDLRGLAEAWRRQPDRVVAAEYAGTTGAPVIFPADLFPELAELQGDRGARVLLSRHPGRVVAVPMASAALDVDTPADLGAVGP